MTAIINETTHKAQKIYKTILNIIDRFYKINPRIASKLKHMSIQSAAYNTLDALSTFATEINNEKRKINKDNIKEIVDPLLEKIQNSYTDKNRRRKNTTTILNENVNKDFTNQRYLQNNHYQQQVNTELNHSISIHNKHNQENKHNTTKLK